MTVLAALLVAAALAPSTALARGRHLCGAQQVNSFTVVTEWPKTEFRGGDTAKVNVTVTRPGPEDPANQGVPLPDSGNPQPVAGAELSIALHGVYPPVSGHGVTDADGKATLKFKIPKGSRGEYDTFTNARIYYATGAGECTDVEERGWHYDRPAFSVKG